MKLVKDGWILLVALSSFGPGALRAQAGDAPVGAVADFERVGADVGPPTADDVQRVRPGDATETVLAMKGLDLRYGDVLRVGEDWLLRLRLAMPGGGVGRVVLATDSEAEDGTVVLGPQGTEGTLRIEPAPAGSGARINLLRGALFLKNWPADASACVVGSGACVDNLGTAYVLRVDDAGRAYLAVTDDEVDILWWAGVDERAPAGECGSVAPDEPCRQRAGTEAVWSWTVTSPPERWDDEARAAIGAVTLTQLYAALDDAVDDRADDVWKESIFKKPLFWVSTGVALGVACIIWCGGDDVTGSVIVNP